MKELVDHAVGHSHTFTHTGTHAHVDLHLYTHAVSQPPLLVSSCIHRLVMPADRHGPCALSNLACLTQDNLQTRLPTRLVYLVSLQPSTCSLQPNSAFIVSLPAIHSRPPESTPPPCNAPACAPAGRHASSTRASTQPSLTISSTWPISPLCGHSAPYPVTAANASTRVSQRTSS